MGERGSMMSEKQNRWEWLLLLQVAVVAVGVIVTVLTAYTQNESVEVFQSKQPGNILLRLSVQAVLLAEEADRLNKELNAARSAQTRQTAAPDFKLAIKLGQIEAQQNDIQQRLKALEDALLATPATSLALPLMRKDLDTMRERLDAAEDTLKWIFGLVATLIIGVVVQWFGSRFKKT